MTLFRQIAILVTVIFVLLAAVIVVNDLNRTREFLQGQLQTTAQDMATTLGIVISNLPDSEDPATLETLFNTVFDSGYYSRIELISLDGETIHEKSQALVIEGIPGWFVNLMPLSDARGSTQVMRGWSQLGRLEIVLHPGFAYANVYENLISTATWTGLMILLALALLWLVLRYLMQPLQKVMGQAEAIQNNRFVQQHQLPRTVDLRQVVEAMNNMVDKVQTIFEDQQQSLSHYKQLLFHDQVTGLGNRRFLLDRLREELAGGQASGANALGVVKINNYDELRDGLGYELVDDIVRSLAALLVWDDQQDKVTDYPARLQDDEFAILVSADRADAEAFLGRLFEKFRQLESFTNSTIEPQLCAGVIDLNFSDDVGEVMSALDYALAQAVDSGPWSILGSERASTGLPQGKEQWRHWLQQGIETHRFFWVAQAVRNKHKSILHRELYVRARDGQGEVLPAAAFMPMASKLGMAVDIDLVGIQELIRVESTDLNAPLALNISAALLEQADSQQTFDSLLETCSHRGIALCIEASHHTLLAHQVMCRQLEKRVHQLGHQFGVDHLDIGQALDVLQMASFDYVKINAQTLQDFGQDSLNPAFQALKTLTDTMNVEIIAVGVDSEVLRDDLFDLGIEYLQGDLIETPHALT
jgi:diguanylate cyclase (GGDEF)-like protein